MELEEFRGELLENVRAAAEAYKDTFLARFVTEAGSRLTDAEEFSDFEQCHFEGEAKRRRLLVDGYAFDEADNSVALVVACYFGEDQAATLDGTDVKTYFGRLRAFIEESLAGHLTAGSMAIEESEPGFGLAHDLMAWRRSTERFRLYLVTDGVLSMRSKDLPVEEIDGLPAEFHVWDVARFHHVHESATGRDDLLVDFRAMGGSLPCLRAGGAEGEYEAYLCMISGDVLADVYDRYGSRLLEGNVRSFLSLKGGVNKGIRTTILNRPEMFFAYNNGISATAEAIELVPGKDGLEIVSATNLQIVNGGQTTASLALAKRKERASLERVYVQMKLSVLPGARAAELIPDIAKYANYQNKVSDADFFSNHPYHIRLEEFSRRLWAPAKGGAQHHTHWFYERARGQYLNEQAKMSRAEKTRFLLQNPRSQLLTKVDVAKLENTWRQLPHKVSLGSQKNFKEFADWITKRWEQDDTQFHEEYFRRLVALEIIFSATGRLVSDQAWYQGGYRANIVTYALAKLQQVIAEQGGGRNLDLRRIWDRQSVPLELMQQMEVVAKQIFDVLTAPDRLTENVTEWAKKEFCWKRVQELEIALSDEVLSKLVDDSEVRAASREARGLQEMDNGIALQSRVLEMGGEKWGRIRRWAEERRLLSPMEASLLTVASSMPRRIPSEKQCARIWDIAKRLIEEGCPDLA